MKHLFYLTSAPLITESLSKVRGVLSDLSAVFIEAVRVWKRRRWLRNYRASIPDPFNTH
jgi:hypothetical protein